MNGAMTQIADFTSTEIALRVAREGAALARPPMPGILRMTGEDALDLVDRLSTNEVVERPAGSGVATVLTTNKGRVVDLLTILYMSDHWLVLTSPGNQQRVIDWIDEFTFGEEIELEDVTEEKGLLSVIGPRGAEAVGVEALEPYHCVEATIAGVEAIVYRGGVGMGGAYNVIVPSGSLEEVWKGLVGAGAREMDSESYEMFRVGAGAPVFGAELGEEVNPLEAGLWEAVSFTKGCYVGQEVVARLNTYEKVKRYLSTLSFEDGAAPEPNTTLTVEGKEVGKITSVAPVTVSGRRAALGYVRKKYAEPGATLTVETSDGPTMCKFVERVGRREES